MVLLHSGSDDHCVPDAHYADAILVHQRVRAAPLAVEESWDRPEAEVGSEVVDSGRALRVANRKREQCYLIKDNLLLRTSQVSH